MADQVRYFHCAPMNLGIGSIIQPGNWGRIIRTMYAAPNDNSIPWTYREAVFEYARMVHAPEKISRLNCLFALQTMSDAIKFRETEQITNIIYEIEPIGDTNNFHIADYKLLNFPKVGQYFDSVFDAARLYWLGENIQHAEVLLPCAARIVGTPEEARLPPVLPGKTKTDEHA